MANCRKSKVETMSKAEQKDNHPEALAETSEEDSDGA
jgi:hypothetical protein